MRYEGGPMNGLVCSRWKVPKVLFGYTWRSSANWSRSNGRLSIQKPIVTEFEILEHLLQSPLY